MAGNYEQTYKSFNKTPILQIPREQGGTLYVFPSAMEDVGLNLNTRANSVSMSHYALINIPKCAPGEVAIDDVDDLEGVSVSTINYKNLFNIVLNSDLATALENENGVTGGDVLARSLQNYAMNFETLLLNRSEYNYQEYKTVSERVFWKWIKECGAIRFKKYNINETGNDANKFNGDYYFVEGDDVIDSKKLYSSVVKCIGTIDSGNSLNTEFGMFNETYINIPSSYGAGPVFFTTSAARHDNNYPLNETFVWDKSYLCGREKDNDEVIYTENAPYTDAFIGDIYNISSSKKLTKKLGDNSLEHCYVTGVNNDNNLTSVIYKNINNSKYAYLKSNLDGIELVKDLEVIQRLLNKNGKNAYTLKSFDDLNISSEFAPESKFEFNAILLYYSIYDTNNHKLAPLATNLFGVLFLDNPATESGAVLSNTGFNIDFQIPTLVKKMSGRSGFGTGYSFRINIKTQSVYDNTDSIINDNTTSNAVLADDMGGIINIFNHAIDALNVNVESTKVIQDNYNRINVQNITNVKRLDELETKINSYIAGDHTSYIDTSYINSSSLYSKTESLDFGVYDPSTELPASRLKIRGNIVEVAGDLIADNIIRNNEYVKVTKYIGTYQKPGDMSWADCIKHKADRNGDVIGTSIYDTVNDIFELDSNNAAGINIVCATVNDSYTKYLDGYGVQEVNTFRNNELFIDPNSPLFDNKLKYIRLNDPAEHNDPNLNVSNYQTANVDYIKLIPYIIAKMQIMGKEINDLKTEIAKLKK